MAHRQENMKIERISLDKLNPAPYNPREADEEDLMLLKKSLEEDGYVEPMVWNERTGNLVAGHQRFKILKKMGMKEIDVSVVNIPLEREKRLNLRLNKQAGKWNFTMLADMLMDLDTGAFDMDLTGFGNNEIEGIMTWNSESIIEGLENDGFVNYLKNRSSLFMITLSFSKKHYKAFQKYCDKRGGLSQSRKELTEKILKTVLKNA